MHPVCSIQIGVGAKIIKEPESTAQMDGARISNPKAGILFVVFVYPKITVLG
jgi:hypothetical protein